MSKRIVVALGHQALGTDFPQQKKKVHDSVKVLADLIAEDCQLIITHSNAPQVGMISTALNEYAKVHETYNAPMAICSSMSQGFIGYDIQNMLRTELMSRGIYRCVSTVVTQVIVDPYDDAFYHPTKVIGRILSKEEAEAEEDKGNYVTEIPGEGFKRIVASPKPLDIVEIDAINALLDAGQIVVAAGGGGVAVLKQGNLLKSASAIIEKDLTAGKLADLTDADMLMILTSEEHVSVGYGTDAPVPIAHLTAADALSYIKKDEFSHDGMLPKIEASVNFVSQDKKRSAIITSIDHALDAFHGKGGTVITRE